jgi:hypothetical protein
LYETNQFVGFHFFNPVKSMKIILLSLTLSAAALMANSTNTEAQSGDVAAIKAVVERETTTWNNRDAAGMADCWANVPEAGQLVSLQDGTHTVVSNHNTKMDMAAGIKTNLAGMGPATKETFQNSDYLIRVKGDAAFAQFEQVVTAADGQKQYAHETRYLEKLNGTWKIVHVGAAFYVPAK